MYFLVEINKDLLLAKHFADCGNRDAIKFSAFRQPLVDSHIKNDNRFCRLTVRVTANSLLL